MCIEMIKRIIVRKINICLLLLDKKIKFKVLKFYKINHEKINFPFKPNFN